MTEEEAAERLCALLNEIEGVGIAVQVLPNARPRPGYHLSVGDGGVYLMEPPTEEEPWELVLP